MRLVNVPVIAAFESPSSWLTRVASMQGIEFGDLHRYLELPKSIDIDLGFTPNMVQELCFALGLKASSFEFPQRMMASLRIVDATGEKYLLWRGVQARYRYCPACIARSREKTFPVHWRMKPWRYCPLHRCLMHDECPHCKAPVILPCSLVSAGKGRGGLPLLDRCTVCGEPLSHNWQSFIGSLDFELLTHWEASMLRNGRAFLSALFQRRVLVSGERGISRLNRLNDLNWAGALPGDRFSLNHEELAKRRVLSKESPRSAFVTNAK